MSVNNESDSTNKKRSRRTREYVDDVNYSNSYSRKNTKGNSNASTIDYSLLELPFPKELNGEFATAIFELGLKHASPKIILPLMPDVPALGTEHIKSHLQKYRIHHQRSRDEFREFYEENMRDDFDRWCNSRGWLCDESCNSSCVSVGNSAMNDVDHNRVRLSSYNSNPNLSSMQYNNSNSNDISNYATEEEIKSLISSSEALQQTELMVEEWKALCTEFVKQFESIKSQLDGALMKLPE